MKMNEQRQGKQKQLMAKTETHKTVSFTFGRNGSPSFWQERFVAPQHPLYYELIRAISYREQGLSALKSTLRQINDCDYVRIGERQEPPEDIKAVIRASNSLREDPNDLIGFAVEHFNSQLFTELAGNLKLISKISPHQMSSTDEIESRIERTGNQDALSVFMNCRTDHQDDDSADRRNTSFNR